MRPTPEALRQTVFPVTEAGYDPAAVDRFILRLADALEGAPAPGTGGGVSEAVAQSVSELLRGAEEAAAAIRAQAEADAEATRMAAEREAEGLRRRAAERAEALIARAHEGLEAAAAGLAGDGQARALEAGTAVPQLARVQGSGEARRNVAETMSAAGFSGEEIERFLDRR